MQRRLFGYDPALPVQEQLTVIAENERMWNMGAEEPGPDAEDEEKFYYIDSFCYAVTDLDDVTADLAECPMEVYYDGKTGSYHYESLDHVHWSGSEGEDYLLDIEIKDNTMKEHIITYVHYKPDKEHCTEKDFEMTCQYYDSAHKKISQKEEEKLEKEYWKGMEKEYMFFQSEFIESKQLKKMEKDKLEGILKKSLQGFSVKRINEDGEFDKSQ